MANDPNMLMSHRITVNIPGELLERLNQRIPNRKRSRYIIQALEEKLAEEEQTATLEEGLGIWSDEDHPELASDEDIEMWIRNLRSNWRSNLAEQHE